MCEVPPPSSTPGNVLLEAPEGRKWVYLRVLLIDEPMSYEQAKVSPQWSDQKKAGDVEL
jgi:hypothetical protein